MSPKTLKLFAALMILSIGILMTWLQEPIKLNNNLGWDGRHYAQMTHQVLSGESISFRPPWVNRFGTIFVAGALSKAGLTINRSWQIINWFAAGLIFVLLSLKGLSERVKPIWFILLLAWWTWHWLGPIRFTAFDPYCADNLAVAAVVFYFSVKSNSSHRLKQILQITALFLGALCREFVCLLPVALILSDWVQQRKVQNDRIVLLISAVLGYLIARSLVTNTMTDGLADGIWYHLKDVAYHFVEIGFQVFTLSLIYVFAPIIAFACTISRSDLERTILSKPLPITIALIWLFSWLGGTDLERYLFWTAPLVIFVLWDRFGNNSIRYSLTTRSTVFWVLLGLLTAINGRWIMTIPEPVASTGFGWPILTAFAGPNPYLMLFMYHAKEVNFMYFISYTGSYALILILLWYFRPIIDLNNSTKVQDLP